MAATLITIAILAGGAASRLDGRDKGLELLDARPLIAWVFEAIQRMDVIDRGIVVIVANRHIDEYSRYATTIRDDMPGFRGPLAGIASALAFCTTRWLMTLPVDCPQPPHDLVRRMLQAVQADDADAFVAHDGERRQPLFAIYRRELSASAANAVVAGQGVWFWQDAVAARELDFSDGRRQFHNLNTPEEFAAYVDRDEA